MKRRIRKPIIFATMLATTVVCLTSTTYAFILMNDSTEVEAFDVHVDSGDGLLISLDGVNFYNALSKEQLRDEIRSRLNNQDFNLSDINLAPVTVKHLDKVSNQIAGIAYNNVNDDVDGMPQSHNLILQKDEVVLNNNATFDSVFNSHHEYVTADSNKDYLTFDLYFKVDGNYSLYNENDSIDGYRLELSSKSFVENVKYKYGETGNIVNNIPETVLENDLTSFLRDVNGDPIKVENSDVVRKYTFGPNQKTDVYDRTKIMVDAANAMRVAFTYEVNNETKIMIIEDENELSLGSAAVENDLDFLNDEDKYRSDYRHDKEYNAMYTYYNNLWKPAFTQAATYGEAFNADNYVQTDVNRKIADFTRHQTNSEDDNYNVIKMTVTIWLEGWDADYFLGIENGLSNFNIWLKFDLVPTHTAKYAVSFDLNYETEDIVATQYVIDGKKAVLPTEPTRDGYTFLGWYIGNTDNLYDFDSEVDAEVALTAHWEQA